ncbi:MAG: hypothetical protein IPO15_25845 [Anaerolineae bacterium]|uniref:hypothetical protein n=1 Tax=Candidatus Amarolinea dominans TaxID=3140696 RepID=UPI0031371AD7|nr:hypothetical protein [Anaerolineae bacterium]
MAVEIEEGLSGVNVADQERVRRPEQRQRTGDVPGCAMLVPLRSHRCCRPRTSAR